MRERVENRVISVIPVISNPFQSYEKPNNDIHANVIVPEKPIEAIEKFKEQTEKEAFFKEMEYR
jgi:hypothetical protein